MDKVLAALGLLEGGACLFSIFSAIGWQGGIYLTIWVLFVELTLFLFVLAGLDKGKLYRILMNISWTLGWQVTIMFWIYVFPLLTEENRLPLPFWFDICAHGGVHLFAVALFFRFPQKLTYQDSVWPVGMGLGYLFLLVLPLKFYGITVYPLFFEECLTTVLVIGQSIVVSFGFFFLGKRFKDEKTD